MQRDHARPRLGELDEFFSVNGHADRPANLRIVKGRLRAVHVEVNGTPVEIAVGRLPIGEGHDLCAALQDAFDARHLHDGCYVELIGQQQLRRLALLLLRHVDDALNLRQGFESGLGRPPVWAQVVDFLVRRSVHEPVGARAEGQTRLDVVESEL